MSSDGVQKGGGNGSSGHFRRPPGVVPAGKPEGYPRSGMSPEQGCFGCTITIAVLLVTVAIWAFIYWYNEPEFHAKPEPPPAQTRIRTPTPRNQP